MPSVHVTASPRLHLPRWGTEWTLWQVCRQIVPAALASPEIPLVPGSIVYQFSITEHVFLEGLDVVVDIDANHNPTRAANVDERRESIEAALHQLVPDVKFAVYLKLPVSSWGSDVDDEVFEGDMSMDAAIARAFEMIRVDRS